MKCDAKTLALRYSDSPQKMSFTQLNYLLKTNEVSYEDFLKELNKVEWKKTMEVFKLCALFVLSALMYSALLFKLIGY